MTQSSQIAKKLLRHLLCTNCEVLSDTTQHSNEC